MKQAINAASFIFLIKDNQFLAMRRANTGYMDGSLSIPSGHIEKGETPTEAARRELKEETGISVNVEDLTYVNAQHYLDHAPQGNTYINHYYACTSWSGEPENTEPDKCSELLWINLQDTPQDLIEQVTLAKKCMNNKIPYSEYIINQQKKVS